MMELYITWYKEETICILISLIFDALEVRLGVIISGLLVVCWDLSITFSYKHLG